MIGAAHCECYIYQAQSLKEKRAVLKSITARLKQKLNVSVAEMDYQNLWQRTAISIVAVNHERTMVEKELHTALDMIDSMPEIERTVTEFEWL
ncbi:hypothetical protein SAMN05192534_101253 [Alteribacillus persepolensis]|uniref:YlxP-like protein n=1 Tax=Alteribacillus persepolensis TaxID=568899 RepID=A0A1G7YSN2_9BACI|nr:DUF503 family protein [Alteribacillus persepolensis]SDG99266.1 hypothetical protein SAMN05192534_101253 [Alteribacillus persepolensis]